jgi:hypothetical protein
MDTNSKAGQQTEQDARQGTDMSRTTQRIQAATQGRISRRVRGGTIAGKVNHTPTPFRWDSHQVIPLAQNPVLMSLGPSVGIAELLSVFDALWVPRWRLLACCLSQDGVWVPDGRSLEHAAGLVAQRWYEGGRYRGGIKVFAVHTRCKFAHRIRSWFYEFGTALGRGNQ